MKFLSVRRTLSAGIIAGASVAAFVAPSAANAALPGHCKGTSTNGQGSSLQAEAQAVWDPGFNANKSAGCVGGPVVTYTKSSSGKGYKQWQELHNYGTVGFIGTDNTVNAAEKEAVENEATPAKGSELLTIPVLQGAVAVVVNLPAGCTASSKSASGRLEINQDTLEGIFKGSVTTWGEVAADEGTGNELKGAGCAEDTITPVVRKDGSGTTHIFKKFLNLTDDAPLAAENGKEETWSQLAEGGPSTVWPTAAKVVHAAEESGGGLLKEVAAKPGSIGYANLADARNVANGGFTGQSPQRFWLEVESERKEKTTSKGLKITRKYQDPASNGDVAAAAESNCKKTEFTNGKGTFPPPTVDSPWNEVTAKQFSKSYPLCGLTYDLALTHYEAFSSFGATAAEAQTVKDFLGYVVSKKGGGKEIKGHDYTPLPKQLEASAEEGVELINA